MSYFNPFLTERPKPDYRPQLNQNFKNRTDLNVAPIAPLSTADGEEGFGVGDGIAAGAAGLSLISNAVGMANQDLGIDKQAPNLQYGASGQPVYSGQYQNDVANATPQKTSAGEVLGGGLQGAQAGFAVGGPLGAAIGGGAGILTTLIGGSRRRKRQEEQKQKAERSVRSYQKDYNLADKQFDDQQIAQQDYNRRMNSSNRLYNLFSATN